MGTLDAFIAANPRFIVVVDANALLSSVDNDCRNGWDSRLYLLGQAGTARLYAAQHVFGEVYRHLDRMCATNGLPVDVLRRRWEEDYLPLLRFVTVDISKCRDPHVAAVTDVADVPTAALAKLLAPCVVFSADKHLRKPGIAPPDWFATARAAIAVKTGDEMMMGASIATVGPPYLAASVVQWAARKLGVSPWLLAAACAAFAVWLFAKAERRATAGRLISPVLKEFAEALSEVLREQGAGLRQANSEMVQPESPTIDGRIARVLARAREPLLVREVQEEVALAAEGTRAPILSVIRASLKENPAFVQVGRYRWQLGSRFGPLVNDA